MTTERKRVSVYPILSVNFVGTLGFSIVLPFLVFLVTRWGGNALVYGVMGGTYSFFQLIGAPILGRWSDRWGRRRILLLSQAGTLLSWIIFLTAFFLPERALVNVDSTVVGSFALTFPLLLMFIARAFDGVTGGNVSVANAYLADITDETERSANFGRMAVAANLGFIVGPAIAGVLGSTRYGELLPVIAALTISVIATLIIALKLPESRTTDLEKIPQCSKLRKVFGQEQRDCIDNERVPDLSVRDMFRLPCVPTLLTIYFLVMLGFNFFYVAFPVHAVSDLEWSVSNTGVFFAVLSGVMVLVQGPVLARASRWYGDGPLTITGSAILAASFLFFQSSSSYLVYGGGALLALGNGLMWPSVLSILSKRAGAHQGVVQGFAGSAGAVASIIGLLAGGLIYEQLGGRVFVLSAVTIAVVAVLALRFGRER
jgi:DHA1 family tetracycline resistance protein-like MFS transporter